MKKTNQPNLFFTLAIGILLSGCGGGTEYDTSKDFTKLEGNSNPSFEQRASANVKEVDTLAEQYRIEQAEKNKTVDNDKFANNINNSNNKNNSNDTANEDINKQIQTMPVTNPSLPPVISHDNDNQVIPQGEVNVVTDSNANN